MFNKKLIISCLIITLFFAGTAFSFGETIALHPIKGEPYEMADMYFEILQHALVRAPGSWSLFIIEEDDNWPADIPPGGFSAILCPRPSITNGAPYAFTGEVAEDPEYYGNYRLRLYLWEMYDEKLISMDELTAPDRSTGEMIMPLLLDNLLSAVGRQAPQSSQTITQTVKVQSASSTAAGWDPSRWLYIGPKGQGQRSNPVDNPDKWVYMGPEKEKWIYLGLRGGMGSSQWLYDQNLASSLNASSTDFWNANVALQGSLHLARFFDIQTEINVAADFGEYGDASSGTVEKGGVFANWSMTVPLLFKLNLQGSHLKAGLYGGLYFYIPIGQTNGDALGEYGKYTPDLPGFTFGLSTGWKLGPGFIFLDGRFEYDGLWFNYGRDPVYYRNTFKVNAGYEIGFAEKK